MKGRLVVAEAALVDVVMRAVEVMVLVVWQGGCPGVGDHGVGGNGGGELVLTKKA